MLFYYYYCFIRLYLCDSLLNKSRIEETSERLLISVRDLGVCMCPAYVFQ